MPRKLVRRIPKKIDIGPEKSDIGAGKRMPEAGELDIGAGKRMPEAGELDIGAGKLDIGDGIDTVNVTVNDTVNVTVNSECDRLFLLIRAQPGKRAEYYAKQLGRTRRSVMRYLSVLSGKIEFRGAPKTGGYYCKE